MHYVRRVPLSLYSGFAALVADVYGVDRLIYVVGRGLNASQEFLFEITSHVL